MFMKTLLSIFFLFAIGVSFSQEKETKISWAQTLDGYNTTNFVDMDVDSKGNTFLTAMFQGPLSDPALKNTLPDPGYVGAALVKYNQNGKPLWMVGVKGAWSAWPRSVFVAKNGDVLLTGSCDGETVFNSVSGKTVTVGRKKEEKEYNQPQFVFLARYSTNGELKWVKALESMGAGISVAEKSNGELYWSVQYRGILKDGETEITSSRNVATTESKYSILKLKANGDFSSLFPFERSGRDENSMYNSRLTVDKEDGLIVYGEFKKLIHFTANDSLTNDGYYDTEDSFIVKFDKDDKFVWCRKIGGQGYQQISSLRLDEKGRISIVGYYSYECVISKGIELVQKSQYEWKSGNSLYYCRFQQNGELDFIRYDKQPGYSGNIVPGAMAIDESGHTHVFGGFTDTLRMEGTTTVLYGRKDIGTSFYSRWSGDSLELVARQVESGKGWISYMDAIIRNNKIYVGGLYWSENSIENVGGKKFKFSEREHGGSSFIYSFQIPDSPEIEEEENNYTESIESVIACLSPKRIAEPNVWIPIETIHSSEPVLAQSGDCGVILENCSALLFPNPTEGLTTLTVKGLKGNLTIQVFSASGQFLFTQDIDIQEGEQAIQLNFSSVEPGTYYVQLVQGNFKKILPLVKSH